MTEERFNEFWRRLRELWPPFPNQNDKVIKQIYWRRFRRYTDKAVESAIGRCLDECKRFPSIAAITERLPDHPFEQATKTGCEEMNEEIRRKNDADKCSHNVEWITNKAGTITGYRLRRSEAKEERTDGQQDT